MAIERLTAHLNDAIVCFQTKIGAYDKDLWEEYMEEKELQEFGKNVNAPMKSTRLKTELIDVDLFRGSNFTKAKPEYAWVASTRRAITRVILFPFCYKWWISNISRRLFFVFLTLYIMQVVSMVMYFLGYVSHGEEKVTIVEVFSPVVLMLILGTTYCQVVSTKVSKLRHLQRKSSRRKFKINYKNQQKRDKIQQHSNATNWNNLPNRSPERSRSTVNEMSLRRRVVSHGSLDKNVLDNHVAKTKSGHGPVYIARGDENVNSRSNEDIQHLNYPIESMETAGDIIITDDNFEDLIYELNSSSLNPNETTFERPLSSNCQVRNSCIPGSDEQSRKGIQEISPKPNSKQNNKFKSATAKIVDSENRFSGLNLPTEGDELWMDKGREDGSSPSSSETSDSSESDEDSEEEPDSLLKHENPFCSNMASIPMLINNSYTSSEKEKVGVRMFIGNECKKTEMTVIEISCAINRKVDGSNINNADYLIIGFLFSAIIAVVPVCYRLHASQIKDSTSWMEVNWLFEIHRIMFGSHWSVQFVTITSLVERFLLSLMYFFMLAVTERTYKQRCLFAKYFTHLTSARRARKSSLPHFRLDRVSSIKAWLSLRSFLKKRGPQRSVDVIVTSTFLVTLLLISLLCTELLRDTDRLHSELHNWDVVIWSFCLSIYLLRFVTLGSEINKKFRNSSLLLTEQINLYLRMERKPNKKDDLMLANNVLKLASKLLKELESPFKISGLSMNPLFYNIIRVIVLSAFSAVLSEVLGFKLKLWKIKT
ncbi:protein PHTF2-like [Antedon mediterranea]|uniref:protein PHTF2-like n=1 Tax=Antedon mediterranea TaxID=105859 RepID=UPI003AF7B770